MELLFPELKLPDIVKFPDPVINYLAPKPPAYPTVLTPASGPGKGSSPPPWGLNSTGSPQESQSEESSPAQQIVKDVVEAVEPTLKSHSEAIGSLQQDLIQFRAEQVSADQKDSQESEVISSLTLPGGFSLPLPKPEILVAAGTTAAVSVAATLTATAVFKKCVSALKPVIKQVINRIQKKLGKTPQSWSRQRLAQRHRRLLNKDSPA